MSRPAPRTLLPHPNVGRARILPLTISTELRECRSPYAWNIPKRSRLYYRAKKREERIYGESTVSYIARFKNLIVTSNFGYNSAEKRENKNPRRIERH